MPITLASNRTFFLWSDIQALDLVRAAKGYCIPVDEFSIKQNISLMRSKVHGELRPFGLRDVLTMKRMTTMTLKTEKMDANNLIAYNLVNRLDDFSIRGSSFPTWYTTRNFGSFCPRLTCETRLLSQGVDFFTPTSYPWDASPALVDESSGRQLPSAQSGTATNRSLPRLALDQNEPPRLVPRRRGERNSGALSSEPFEMFGLNFQVSIWQLDTGSSGERKKE